MATIALTVNTINRSGLLDPAGQAVGAADDAEVVNEEGIFLRVVWGGTGGALTLITPTTLGESPALTVADPTVSFTASQVKFVGPFPAGIYQDSNGKVKVDPD